MTLESVNPGDLKTLVYNGTIRQVHKIYQANFAYNNPEKSIGRSRHINTDEMKLRAKFHAEEFFRQVQPQSVIASSDLIDRVLDSHWREVFYSPANIDHGAQHSGRVRFNGLVVGGLSAEIRDLPIEDQIDSSVSRACADVGHDFLQNEMTVKGKSKRLHHDLLAGMFFMPGLMILGNLQGITKFSDRQIALASAVVRSHEIENDAPDYGLKKISPTELIKQAEADYGVELSQAHPVLAWLAAELDKYGVDLYNLEIDYSLVNENLYRVTRQGFIADDLGEQVAPSSWAAMRTIKAVPGRLLVDFRHNIQESFDLISKSSQGYSPGNAEYFDTTLRAAVETARGLQDVSLPSVAKSWMKWAQLSRGDYHTKFVRDMMLLGKGKVPVTVSGKYLELMLDMEAELKAERGISTSELSSVFKQEVTLNDLDRLQLIKEDKFRLPIANDRLRHLGEYVLKEYAIAALSLRDTYHFMTIDRGVDFGRILAHTEEVIDFAKSVNGFRASAVDLKIFTLKKKKIVLSLSEY